MLHAEINFTVKNAARVRKILPISRKTNKEDDKKKEEGFIKEEIKKLTDLKNTEIITELSTLHTQGVELVEPSDLSGAIRGRHNLYAHLEYMIKNAEKNVTLMTTSKGLVRKVESLKPTLEKLKRKGVNIRIVAPITKECANVAKDLSKIAEVRASNGSKVIGRFVIVDGKHVMFMVMDDDKVHPTYDIGVWVTTPYFASTLDNFFLNAWKDMTPLVKVKV